MAKLKKSLNFIDIYALATGAMISSGLFILPSIAYMRAGPAVALSYLIAGFYAFTGVLSQAELASAMPKAGGEYFYVMRSMGPLMGTVNGIITWFTLALKSAFALVGMAAFLHLILPWDTTTLALIGCLIFVLLNYIGVQEASRMQIILVAFLLLLLAIYIIKGFAKIEVDYFKGFLSAGWPNILGTAGMVFVSYGGLLKVTSVAEETNNPARTVPLGLIVSLLITTIIYFLTVFVTTGLLGPQLGVNSAGELNLTPISQGALVAMGKGGQIALSLAAMFAFISTANAGIMAASRYPFALSRDKLLPEFLSRVNRKNHTPHWALLLTASLIIIMLFVKLKILVESASTVLILSYMFSSINVIVMRESRVQNYQPKFRSPLYPWVQLIGIIGALVFLLEIGYEAIFISVLFIIFGAIIYIIYGRYQVSREFALLKLVERITDKQITGSMLETELREIIRERDDIVKDRFDHLIEQGEVIEDADYKDIHQLFKAISPLLAKKLNLPVNQINSLLEEREKESSTAISSFLAIPHIIIPGENKFAIFLIRSIKGIYFSDKMPKVHAIFILAGTKDERNFHLKALASLAQIVQNPDFEQRWVNAIGKQGLKDVILLGKRRRYFDYGSKKT